MKNVKALLTLITFLISLHGFSQSTVLQGITLLQDRPAETRYVLLHMSRKDVESDVKKYLTEFGKVVESPKNHFKVDNPRSLTISSNLYGLVAKVEEYKELTTVYFIFLGRENKVLNRAETDEYKAAIFVENFAIMANKNQEIRLAELDLKQTEDNYSEAQKNVKKIEKSLESNLKEQEKLGKKLEASPEEMTRLLSEKEEITKKMYGDPETATPVTQSDEELKKAALKKEKEIAKNQRDKEKASSKLEKKENEFTSLKNDLFEAKGKLKNAEIILDNKKSNLRVLTK